MKAMSRRFIARGVLAAGIVGVGASLNAAVLMLDFGPVEASGRDRSNSPYHTASNGSVADQTWNQVQNKNISSGLLFSDGTEASGVSLKLGRSSANDLKNVVFDISGISSASLGNGANTKVYSGTSVAKDGILFGANASLETVLGVAIGGLAAGTYDIYVTGFNTNQGITNAPQESFWAIDTASASRTINTTTLGSSTVSLNNVSASWVEGGNYVKLTVTIEEGHYLTIISTGTGENEKRGFLNSIQIVPVGITLG
jgi:hypothetical protein